MEKIFSDNEKLYIHSMGKALQVTAIFTDTETANKYMAKPGNMDGVIATFEPFIFLANISDKGLNLK